MIPDHSGIKDNKITDEHASLDINNTETPTIKKFPSTKRKLYYQL